MNIYGPNNEDLHIYTVPENTLIENNSETILLGGDFNNVLDFNLDKLNGRRDTNKKCSAKLNELIIK